MKSVFVLNLFILFFLQAYNQSKDSSNFALGVEKEYSTYKKSFVFKPDKTLKIMTLSNIKYASDKYFFSDKFIVMDMKDTILFDNIAWIKGVVYDNKGRKIAGASVVIFAFIVGYSTAFVVAYGGGPFLLAATPFIGAMYGGFRLIGARKFRRTQDCYVKVIQQQSPSF